MIAKLLSIFIFNYYVFVEAFPHASITNDLRIIKECNVTHPIDRNSLNMVLTESMSFSKNVEDSFKCFLQCLYQNYNWMDTNGVFQEKEMKESLAESNLDESSIEYLLATCKEIDMENKCEKAFMFTKCFRIESEKMAS